MKSALDSLISLPGVTVEGRSQVEGLSVSSENISERD
jgi:hypothetical protein